MELLENPTRKVRGILATRLQCPDYKISEKDLYEIKKLCDYLDTTISTMKLHAGDCCSLNNEVELFRGHWEDAEERAKQLELQLKEKDELLFAYESVHTPIGDKNERDKK
jgi:hypothetical protein